MVFDPGTRMRNILGMPRDIMMGLAPSEPRDSRIKIHGPEAFEGMRQAGRLAAETLDFPKSICTSINHVVCHGIPGERRLMEGDILNIDVTVILDGWHGDTSRMFFVGERVAVKARRLVDVTYEAMMRGIVVVQPGIRV